MLDGLSGVHDLGGGLDVARDSVGDENGVGGGEQSSRPEWERGWKVALVWEKRRDEGVDRCEP